MSKAVSPTSPTKAIAGTLAVALLLAGSRWGSYIGYSPLFLTDILIAVAIMDWVLGRTTFGAKPLNGQDRPLPPFILALFFAYVLLRALTSVDYAFSMGWVRDVAPFLYAAMAFVSASSFARSSKEDRDKTVRYIWWALIFHLAWTSTVVISKVDQLAFPLMPASTVPILSTRPDADMAFLGVTAALLLRRVIRGEKTSLSLCGMLLAVLTAAMMHSRAGLISMAITMGTAYVATYRTLPHKSNKRTALILSVPVILAIALAVLSQSIAGSRLIASALNTSTGSEHEQNAQGTERARELVWSGIFDWVHRDPLRTLFGSGFGNDFLTQSGVISFLQGTEYFNVRSPHNWLVGVYARTGVIGAGFVVIMLLALIYHVLKHLARIGSEELPMMAAMIILGIIPVSMMGVVLEAPFGAVPFWWAVGIIFAIGGNPSAIKGKLPRKASEDTHTRRLQSALTRNARPDELKLSAA